MKLTAKVILSYLGLGVGALGTYAAASVFDNTQIEDVVEDYEDNDSEVVDVETRSDSSESVSVSSEEPKAPEASAQTAPQKTSTVVTKPKVAKARKPARKRGSRLQTLQRVKDGGPRVWERFAELARNFVMGRKA